MMFGNFPLLLTFFYNLHLNSILVLEKGLISNANGSYMSFTRVLVLEIGLNKDFRFLDRKKNYKKKTFCRPTDPNFFWHVTLNRGTFFLALYGGPPYTDGS